MDVHDVIKDIDQISMSAVGALGKLDISLHEDGYHQWSAIVSNLRHDFETAMHKAIDTLYPAPD